jgi:16S rRNA (uracil1498-N3)-methyltransferase
MDLVLQKGTELGMTAFTPVLAERSIPSADRGEKRRQRWERIIREAAQQSRRTYLPRLDKVLPLTDALRHCGEDLRLLLWEEESRPLADILPAVAPRDVAVLVGPEGGFSVGEVALARRAGFIPVSLGQRILAAKRPDWPSLPFCNISTAIWEAAAPATTGRHDRLLKTS